MFKGYASYLNFDPEDGMNVVILGTVSVFERDGVYQVYVLVFEQFAQIAYSTLVSPLFASVQHPME